MMRPMKLAGSQLLFGRGCLEHLKTLSGRRAVIVTGGSSMKRSGILDRVITLLAEAGIESRVFAGVEPDPAFSTVMRGAMMMREYGPDWLVALGGGSAMDAAKAMWVYYEHPEFSKLDDLFASPFPALRARARLVCIPSTSGTASEVSRSIVVTDDATGQKRGIGNMEMMPDVALCDPEIALTMPPFITAETGMDALTHALEALVSTRANYLSDILAKAAALDIVRVLHRAWEDGRDLDARETMMNASMTAGLAFTNVSLGIVHSMAHALGSCFGVAHGLADAILLPYVIRYNSVSTFARDRYDSIATALGGRELDSIVEDLNRRVGIPATLSIPIPDKSVFLDKLGTLCELAVADGCTKTNPVKPDRQALQKLFLAAYEGRPE